MTTITCHHCLQRELFPPSKEDIRLDTIERLFGTDKRVQTAARFFDDQGEREAERLAKRTAPDTKSVAQ